MSKYLLTIGLFFLGVTQPIMANANTSHLTYETFDFNKSEVNYFYCSVKSNKVTEVSMENHNVLISGFDKGGKLFLQGQDVDKLNHYYFTAKADPNKSGYPNVVIHFKGGRHGDLKCDSGRAGRGSDFGSVLGR